MSTAPIAHPTTVRPRRLRSLLANTFAAPGLELEHRKSGDLESVDNRASHPATKRFTDPSLDDVAELFQRQLETHPQFRGRGRLVEADYHEGILRLSGCLPSFYLKQQVQALAHRTPGVTRVVNRIDVRDAVIGDGELETWWLGTQAAQIGDE